MIGRVMYELSCSVWLSQQADSSDEPGVIYVGHIPRGFYEPQMRKYFSQFGKVTRLKLSRSKRVRLMIIILIATL